MQYPATRKMMISHNSLGRTIPANCVKVKPSVVKLGESCISTQGLAEFHLKIGYISGLRGQCETMQNEQTKNPSHAFHCPWLRTFIPRKFAMPWIKDAGNNIIHNGVSWPKTSRRANPSAVAVPQSSWIGKRPRNRA